MFERPGFGVGETHGILLRPDHRIRASSDGLGWSTLYASAQLESPYESCFAAVDDHLIILHRDGPVPVDRALGRDREMRLIPPGGMFMMPGGMDFGVRLGGALNTVHLYLRRALVAEVASEMLGGDPLKLELLPRFGDSDPLLERLILAIGEAMEDFDESARAYVDHLSRAMAARLIRSHSTAAPAPEAGWARHGVARSQLAHAIDFMQANLDRSISLASIAAAADLSPSHFARQFRLATGLPPHQFLLRLRIDRASRLLAQTDLPVAEVALSCGFSHQEHLTRVFKRACSSTPAAYRRAQRGPRSGPS